MIGRGPDGGGSPASDAALKVGLFGLLGSGNSGNDASMETVLAYLREAHPDAVVDALCGGPERVRASYGIDAAPLFWYQKFEQRKTGAPAAFLKVLGKGIDTVRIASWVRRHDAVIVPGAGALETTLPQQAWGFPYALFLLTTSGKLFGTKVALVSVGADLINKRANRWLSNATARLASYRSYRDAYSRDAMRQRGIDTSSDRVYPDLVFGVPTPPYEPGDPQLVGVGVMAYYGGNDDRKQAAQIHSRYVETMTLLHPVADRQRLPGPAVRGGQQVRRQDRRENPGRPATVPTRSRAVASHRRSCLHLPGTHPGDGARRHGRGHALPQRDVRAQALQAYHLAGILAEIHLPDGGHGTRRIPPVR